VIEHRAVAVQRLRECFHEVREHLYMVLVELCVFRNSPRIFTVMRPAVESERRRFAVMRATAEKKLVTDKTAPDIGGDKVLVTVNRTS
jgi:hypothetical protein